MRDEEVFKLVHAVYNIPIAILIGGGYHYVSIMHNITMCMHALYQCVCDMCVYL